MALFGSSRDISMFRKINRELLGDIITQQCAVYKFRLEETNINIFFVFWFLIKCLKGGGRLC